MVNAAAVTILVSLKSAAGMRRIAVFGDASLYIWHE